MRVSSGVSAVVGVALGVTGFAFLERASEAKRLAAAPLQGVDHAAETARHMGESHLWDVGGWTLLAVAVVLLLVAVLGLTGRRKPAPATISAVTVTTRSASLQQPTAPTVPVPSLVPVQRTTTAEAGGGVQPARMPCPDCGESISVQARLCRFCGMRLDEGH